MELLADNLLVARRRFPFADKAGDRFEKFLRIHGTAADFGIHLDHIRHFQNPWQRLEARNQKFDFLLLFFMKIVSLRRWHPDNSTGPDRDQLPASLADL